MSHEAQVTSKRRIAAPADFAKRVTCVYRKAHDQGSPEDVSMWKTIISGSAEIHEAMLAGNDVSHLLDNPVETNMMLGFDNLCRQVMTLEFTASLGETTYIHDLIHRLAQAVGVVRLPNPEQPQNNRVVPSSEAMLEMISRRVGCEIDFPNPFPCEIGLQTSRGIVSYRAVQAIYQAWRIKGLTERYGKRVVEIGAGLGRTAYYANKFGITDYTIVDLPFTNVSQANFLCRVLPATAVSLFGERPVRKGVRVLPPAAFPKLKFDVLVNVDSLTEMGPIAMRTYTRNLCRRNRRVFWSVNHEVNSEVVHELPDVKGKLLGRFPYWMRDGYVEEIFV